MKIKETSQQNVYLNDSSDNASKIDLPENPLAALAKQNKTEIEKNTE